MINFHCRNWPLPNICQIKLFNTREALNLDRSLLMISSMHLHNSLVRGQSINCVAFELMFGLWAFQVVSFCDRNAHQAMFCKNYFDKFREIHWKTPALESASFVDYMPAVVWRLNNSSKMEVLKIWFFIASIRKLIRGQPLVKTANVMKKNCKTCNCFEEFQGW